MKNKYPHPFSNMAKEYRKFRKDLTLVASNIAENEFVDNFGRNKTGGFREKGVFTGWQARKKIKGKRDSKRSVLVKSGRLRRSFSKRPDFNYARVVNTAPYAQIHNEGGIISGTFKVREHMRKKSKVKQHMRTVKTKIPKRPFMVTNSHIIEAIDKHVENSLNKIFKS